MRFSPDFLDEIRARLPVSAVVGRKVRLKKQGREWRGLSPFTSEKTPSFYVNDPKGRWFDFSAGKNGNIFDFVMEVEGLSFPDAVEKLASEAGLALPVATREDSAREAARLTTLDALEEATRFFEAQLRGPAGERARTHLADRGLREEVAREFRLGFAPRDRFALWDHLANKGLSRDVMIEGGLLVHGEGIEVPYDRFRDRIIFPIQDRSGRVIAFGGRALDPTAPAKYLNSPETALFHKGYGLYNHHRARRAAPDAGRVIAVEGYVDAIAMVAAEFPETVASLGTALTIEQCALLWQMADAPILCFDGDRAGRKAAARAMETALPLIGAGRTLRFALLPDGLDPDDLVRAGGPAAMETVLAGARPLVEMLWTQERDARPLDTPEAQTGLLRRLETVTEPIGDADLRKRYLFDLRGRAYAHFREMRPAPAASGRPRQNARPGDSGSRPLTISDSLSRSPLLAGAAGGLTRREALILALLVEHPGLIGAHVEEIASLPLPSADADRLRHLLIELADDDVPDGVQIAAAIDAAGCQGIFERIRAMTEPMRARSTTEGVALDAAVALRQALALQLKGPALNNALQIALTAFDADPSDKNWEILRDVRAQVSSKEGLEAILPDPSSKSALFSRGN